ncbi:MAG TPA: lytic transglycosylase domain-containing protein [Trueperaceae bacterium]|nr:lytic transglycosylase domain-containing protein [Trueperaceae bacterium]
MPGSEDAALGAAWCLFYLGRDAEAAAAFSALGSAGNYGLGLLANRAGDIDRAIDLLTRTGRADVLWLSTGILEARDRFSDTLPIYLELARGGSSYADDAAYRAHVLAGRLGLGEVAAKARALIPEGNFFALRLGSGSLAPDPSTIPATAVSETDDPELVNVAATIDVAADVAAAPASTAEALELAAALYAVHEEDAAVGELLFALRRAEEAAATEEVLALGEMLQSMDEYRHSVSAARGLIAAGVDDLRAWRLAYPPAWPDIVIGAAEAEGIEPGLIWAVMRQESAFSEVAVSVADAQGLMQVIPSTWDWIAELRDEQPGDPFDIAANVAYGATYLAWLIDYFDGDMELVIASYNGGQGYVRRLYESEWVNQDKDEFYREIDRSETREYLQRVYENLAVYRTLYPSIADVERQHYALASAAVDVDMDPAVPQ